VLAFTFVPFGNAFYASAACPATTYEHTVRMCWNARCNVTSPPTDCFGGAGGTLVCQHGDKECVANRMEGCAIKLAGSSIKAFPFIHCYEVENGCKAAAAETCAAQAGIKYADLQTCVTGPAGLAVDAANAKMTALIPGGHVATPWPVINGQNLDQQKDLLAAVCDAIVGTKPAGCP
jgi:interferon gamma-inducible protein 30